MAKKQTADEWAKGLQANHSDVLELHDNQTVYLDTKFLSKHVDARFEDKITAKLGQQFLNLNRDQLNRVKVDPEIYYSGDELKLKLKAHTRVGAIPLLSPVTHKYEYSLIITPRFGWQGIGPILSTTGWKVLPNILNLPQLKISERRVPPWVLSSVILGRLEKLLQQLDRRFEIDELHRSKPKGKVDWADYARKQVPEGKFLNFKCRYPELQENRELKSVVHFALKRQRQSLLTQRDSGVHVLQLLDFCNRLIQKVAECPPKQPSNIQIDYLQSSMMQGKVIDQGLEAIVWTTENKGLAGLGDLSGLPWMMNMEELFESYVESVMEKIVKKTGGTLKSGRRRETVVPLSWEPPFLGSQGSLIPDLMIDKGNHAYIIDAKYKDHWEDLNIESWYNISDTIRERHRNDLLQILAYASLPENAEISCCLMYPCKQQTWKSLVERDRHIHTAEMTRGDRHITLHLSAIPFSMQDEDLGELKKIFQN
jgi:5-methylcytosine-specific restriction endonuclease McrBC regulatory subunit McrC